MRLCEFIIISKGSIVAKRKGSRTSRVFVSFCRSQFPGIADELMATHFALHFLKIFHSPSIVRSSRGFAGKCKYFQSGDWIRPNLKITKSVSL